MRVISGAARGSLLFSPIGKRTRPTSDFVKENLFNIIGNDVLGAIFLDLFAGSGQIGIEALSRGAGSCVFVDISKSCMDLIEKNLIKTKLKNKAAIIKNDANVAVKKLAGQKFDIIFMDAPYFEDFVESVLSEIKCGDVLADGGYVIIEISRATNLPEIDGFEIFKEREYSGTRLVFLRRK